MLINGKEWKLVPAEPTTDMIVCGFESAPHETFSSEEEWTKFQAMTGCEQAHYRTRVAWAAMLAASPAPPEATEAAQTEDLTYRQLYEDACILANNNALEAIRNAKDAARYRWAIEKEDNAEELYFNVLCNAGDRIALDATIDAAIAAGAQTAQSEPEVPRL